jgi:hypothetical protein
MCAPIGAAGRKPCLLVEVPVKRQLAYQICYVIATVAAFGGTAHAAGIATVTDVVNDGYRTPPGHEEQAAKRADELVQNEALRTEEESTIQVKFVDGSQLSVEQSSEMVLSDYVYDGSASAGLINLNDGLFHFTSNGNNDQGVKLKTPVATIGVRGTEFLVHVDGNDATIIDILSGAVEAKPNGKGKAVTCVGGQSILVAGADEDAMCGDLGSFSAAAGSSGPDRSPEPGRNEHGGGAGSGGNGAHEPPHDPPSDGGDGGGGGGDPTGGGELSDSGTGLPFGSEQDPDFG